MRWIATRLRDNPPDQLWLEETSLRPTDTLDLVLRLSGLFMIFGAAARTKGVPVKTLDVRTVRASFLGNGNLKRDEAKRRTRAMCRLLGWDVLDDDQADAGAIWWNACAICCPSLTPKISPSMRAHVALPPLAVVP